MRKRTGWFGAFLSEFTAAVFITGLMGTGILASLTFGVPAANAVDSSSTAVKGVVYVGSDDGIYALDAETGQIIWVTDVGSVNSLPNVVKDMVYVASASYGEVYALNAATGEIIWATDFGAFNSWPSVVKEIVYVGSDDGIYALDAETGLIIWVTDIGSSVVSPPNVVKDMVYVAVVGGIHALNAATGELIW